MKTIELFQHLGLALDIPVMTGVNPVAKATVADSRGEFVTARR